MTVLSPRLPLTWTVERSNGDRTGLLCNISYQAKAVHVALGNGTKTTSTNYTYYEGANVDVDNVCMWKDVALTDEQVAALYANQQKSETVVIGSTGYGTLCPSDEE